MGPSTPWQPLLAIDDSRCEYSPENGEGWNAERREVWELNADIADRGLVTNDYRTWHLTKEGRSVIS